VKDEFHNVPLRDRKFVYSMPLLEIFHMTRLVIILACQNVPSPDFGISLEMLAKSFTCVYAELQDNFTTNVTN
jgi:hypothetical protein